jgi:hypothetical protein
MFRNQVRVERDLDALSLLGKIGGGCEGVMVVEALMIGDGRGLLISVGSWEAAEMRAMRGDNLDFGDLDLIEEGEGKCDRPREGGGVGGLDCKLKSEDKIEWGLKNWFVVW